jgi:ubiquinone/menaquinone biosynthesis C-methylase UbiE
MGTSAYTFGDSALAAARLALLAELFADTTTSFLRRLQVNSPRMAVDLGCGPGFTTELLRDVLGLDRAARVIAVDSSPAFVREAAQRLRESAVVVVADVMDLPGAIAEADLLFARFLLTHLAEPKRALQAWVGRLAPRGVLAVEEAESISAEEPVLAAYLDLQRRMLSANQHQLEVGPLIAETAHQHGWAFHSEIVAFSPPVPTVARMFAMNFETWRNHPTVVEHARPEELDDISDGLAAVSATEVTTSITWKLRQLAITKS